MTPHSDAEFEAAAEYYLEQLRAGDFDEAFHGLIDLDPAILRPLIAAYHAETSRDVRSGLLRILWEFRLPSVLPLLEEALRDRRDDRWKSALDGLVTLASPGSVQVLERVIAEELAASNPEAPPPARERPFCLDRLSAPHTCVVTLDLRFSVCRLSSR